VTHFNNHPTNKIPLLCVHGFSTNPAAWLTACSENPAGSRYTAVPVIWPCGELPLLLSYWGDRGDAWKQAVSLQSLLLDPLQQEVGLGHHVSLMCHSMGNYILLLAAAGLPAIFDNIFMVVADVDNGIFKVGRVHGHSIPQMVRPGGRVHVLYSNHDLAMVVRFIANCGKPGLGRTGPVEIADAIEDRISPINANNFNPCCSGVVAHNYQFSARTVDYYDSTAPDADADPAADPADLAAE
jgi:esterase/lipase superfamily enzyme